jgi:hypothetical protein
MTAESFNDHNNYSSSYKQVPVSQRSTDTTAVRTKVEEDIAFLHARIKLMESHPRPNRVVLETYQGMLNSRIAVLKWLLHGSDDSDISSLATKRSA